jgi:hypothetical protein
MRPSIAARKTSGNRRKPRTRTLGPIAQVWGWTKGVDLESAVRDAMTKVPTLRRPLWFQVIDIGIHQPGGDTGLEGTQVIVNVWPAQN